MTKRRNWGISIRFPGISQYACSGYFCIIILKERNINIKTIIATGLLAVSATAFAQNGQQEMKFQEEQLNLTMEWDKTFPQSDKVNHSKITFHNRYGITLAADLYIPKNAEGKLPAIAISGPFGAVKEQSSGLYAQTLAERGFLTIAFDPSFTGESGGQPRSVASPDINTEDFSAAVDYLATRDDVDAQRIGILGICGFGGFAINAATESYRPGMIRAGDLMLYGSSCVVLFYETFSSGYSYTRLGRIDNPEGLSATVGGGNVTVSFIVNK